MALSAPARPAGAVRRDRARLPGAGFVGANVTIPHKRAALELSDRASATARAIGAANTLAFGADGTISAENTDAPGLIGALADSPRGRSALILGAGGSARAAAWALREAGAGEVMLWSRTPERARELALELSVRAVPRPLPADLLVNCTPVGLGLEPSASDEQALNQLALTFDQVGKYSYVIDIVYRSEPTPLLAAAREHGSRTLDGLEILVAQGALSFEMWTGRTPPLEVMRRAAREGTVA